jgi:hypothetical protein
MQIAKQTPTAAFWRARLAAVVMSLSVLLASVLMIFSPLRICLASMGEVFTRDERSGLAGSVRQRGIQTQWTRAELFLYYMWIGAKSFIFRAEAIQVSQHGAMFTFAPQNWL